MSNHTTPRPTAVFDIETYVNYFLVCFRRVDRDTPRAFEFYKGHPLDVETIKRILRNHRVVSFNGRSYDVPMLTLALSGATNAQLKRASDDIILGDLRPWQFEEKYEVKPPAYLDHIDLIEVAPGQAGLKIYGGRIHSKRMQDLPIEPDEIITPEQRPTLVAYCGNDLQTTIDLYNTLLPQVELRNTMSVQYGEDLRSKSDAQIAEAVIRSQVQKLTGRRVMKPDFSTVDRTFRYRAPSYIQYQTEQLKEVLRLVQNAKFVVSSNGSVEMPKALADAKIEIGKGVYRMGIGGLHSSEKSTSHVVDDNTILVDRDVASYYPSIILTQSLAPKHLGSPFLKVYRKIVEERLNAKRQVELCNKSGDKDGAARNKVVADSLKITINGSFGKFGSKYSTLYSPNLMIQVTVTGQLSLLLLIETLELRGIPVVSANTDGIVIKCPKEKYDLMNAIILDWEIATGFETEETRYRALHSRDVNNYIAIGVNGKVKTKGAFAYAGLQKNPSNEVCIDAVVAYLRDGTPIEDTIDACEDIRKFVTIRQVRGGAHKDGEYLGKAVRYYYAEGEAGTIKYVTNGNIVPRTEGAKPLMELPDSLPNDIDYEFYCREAYAILDDLGVDFDDNQYAGRTGLMLARRPDQKTIHHVRLPKGVALCGHKPKSRREPWVEYQAQPENMRLCSKCKGLL